MRAFAVVPSLLFLVVTGCSPRAPVVASAPADVRVPTPSAGPPLATVPKATPPEAPKTPVNLLDVVPAKVSVSSAVRNPRDFPEHLVDGRLDTAWNGKTNDLAGGWIAFRVPADTHVTRVELTAGYDKVKGALDLFAANHRIAKVRVSRNGVSLGEHTLDTSVRGFQSISIDAAGGDYEIKVLATVAGTKAPWRELVVSELRVVGIPGKERRAAGEPLRVSIGGLDEEPESYALSDTSSGIVGPAATIPELCALYLAKVAAAKADIEETAKSHGLTLEPATCVELPNAPPFAANATYKKVLAVRMSDGIRTTSNLVLGTVRGLFVLPITWAVDDQLDPGCPSIVRVSAISAVRTENGHFLAVTEGDRGTYDLAGKFMTIGVTGASFCTEKGQSLTCAEYPSYMGSLGAFAIAPDGTLRRQD